MPEGARPVLEALASGGGGTVPQLASWLGVHPNTVRARLRALQAAALVERQIDHAGRRGRPVHRYRPTPAGRGAVAPRARTGEYQALAGAFAAHLADTAVDPPAQARAVGRSWGHQLADITDERVGPATDRVVALLEDLGFGPHRDLPAEVALRTCPLLDLATRMPQVVCEIHAGLVEGALQQYGADSMGVELSPFAEPGACRLRLAPGGGAQLGLGAPGRA